MDVQGLRRVFEERGVVRVKLAGIDVDGVLRGKYVSLEKFYSAAEEGFGFCDVIFGWDSSDRLYDNVGFTGWHTGYPDAVARVDLSTARFVPWEGGVALFLVDFFDRNQSPLVVSPRQLLRRVGQRAEAMGFAPRMAAEYEFFVFRETPHSLRDKGYKNAKPLSPGMFGYSILRTSASAELVGALVQNHKTYFERCGSSSQP